MQFRINWYLFLLFVALTTTFTSKAQQASVGVKLAKITQQTLQQHLLAYGTVEATTNKVTNLTVAQAAIVNQLWVNAGQAVKKGDKLVEIGIAPEARMQYLQVKNSLEYAKQQLARMQRMLLEKLVTQADVELAQRNLLDNQASLDALIKNQQDNLQQTIVASVDGVISKLNVTTGDRIAANSSLLLIAAETQLIARLGISPQQRGHLQANTEVELTSVFDPNVSLTSHISDIHAIINPTSHLIDTLVPIPEKDAHQLLIGSAVIAQFKLDPHVALVVPRSAVLNDDNGDYIFRVSNKLAEKIYIKIELEQDNTIAISGPIEAEQDIVILGNYVLQDGMTVRELN